MPYLEFFPVYCGELRNDSYIFVKKIHVRKTKQTQMVDNSIHRNCNDSLYCSHLVEVKGQN